MPPYRSAAHLRPAAPAFTPCTAAEPARRARPPNPTAAPAVSAEGRTSAAQTAPTALFPLTQPPPQFTTQNACTPPAAAAQRRSARSALFYAAVTRLTLREQAEGMAREAHFLARPGDPACRSLIEYVERLMKYRGDAQTLAILRTARHMVSDAYGFDEAEAALRTASCIADGPTADI